ncbi:MAG: hypothetical protein HQK50_05965 [Oligoflexia bacterium]|nr:hypothetical protein [Oligoflexia bacterium]MBF0365096.1 hypothetical protein [Oligoflexia bacterium]
MRNIIRTFVNGINNNAYGIPSSLVIAFFSYLTISSNVPKPISPFSVTVVFPMFIAIAIVGKTFLSSLLTSFFCSSLYIIIFNTVFKKWSKFAQVFSYGYFLIILCSIYYYIKAFDFGMKYQGSTHTYTVTTINMILISIVTYLNWRSLIVRTPFMLKFSGTVFFLWFFWISFPWLGELI